MTNKEKYKQAFSVLHPSGKLSLEVEKMTMIQNKKKKFRAAAAATAACLFVACGGGIAYAAGAVGIQRKVQVWLNGEETLYMTIKYQDGYCTSPHKYQNPDSL